MDYNIKFRGHISTKNRYVYFDLTTLMRSVYINSISDDIELVEQFTGYIDKNGTEVYEGDTVKYVSKQRGKIVEIITTVVKDRYGFFKLADNKTKLNDYASLVALRNFGEVI